MLSKIAITLPLAASLLEQVNAFSFHRHQHAAQKRQVVWHTEWQTVYVTADAPAQTANAFVQDSQPEAVAVTPTVAVAVAAAAAPAQTTLSTAVKPSSTSTASSGGLGVAKQGIAYNDPLMANVFKNNCNKNGCGWAYNWGSDPAGLSDNLKYVPMLWGNKTEHTSHWDADAEKAISNKGATHVLSFNEPDLASQADLKPKAAADAHAYWLAKYKGRVQIGAPAVSNSPEKDQGLQWLQEFVTACDANSDCHYDFCPVHWYSPAEASDTLFTHLERANEICHGKGVWLTEFAPTGSDEQITSFLKTVVPKLESLDYVQAYSYFFVAQNILMSSANTLSSIGNTYAAMAN